jgi:probable O-glycosylation ligase (exosortase A-associated)
MTRMQTGFGPDWPPAASRPAGPGREVAREAALGRRVVYYGVATLLCVVGAAALVMFSPEIAIGLVIASVCGVMVMVRPFWGLLLYTCLFLIRPGELYPALGVLHLERVVGAVTLAGMFFAQQQGGGRLLFDRSRQTGLLMALLGAALLSVPFAYWPRGAGMGFIEMLKLVALYLLIVHLVDSHSRLRIYIWLLSLLTVYIAADAYISYLRGAFFFAQGIDRAVGETSVANNPNQLGTTMAIAIPFFLLLALHRPLRGWRIFFGLSTLLCTVTMMLTGSRASLLGFVAGMGFLWLTSRRRLLVAALALPLLVASFVALPGQYQTRYGSMTSERLDGSSQARVDTWVAGLQMAIDRPLFGVGIHCFGTAHASHYSPENRRNWLESHSLYIQVLAEMGLVGAVTFALLLIEFFRLNRRAARALAGAGERWGLERTVLRGLLVGFVVLIVSGIFGHSLLRYTWYVYAALGLSILRLYHSETDVALPADAGSVHVPGR